MKLKNLWQPSAVILTTALVISKEHAISELSLESSPKVSNLPSEIPPVKDHITGTDDKHPFNHTQTSQNAFDEAIERWQARTTESFTPVTNKNFWAGSCSYVNDHAQQGITSNKTVYQLIVESKYTTFLARLINENEKLVAILNGTAANWGNVTFFAPIDSAFEGIMPLWIKLSKQDKSEILAYLFASEVYTANCLLMTHTIASTLASTDLGGKFQRLSISIDLQLEEWRVNSYSRIIAADIFGSNGVIHGLDRILGPPPNVISLISYPSDNYTIFKQGLQKTGLDVVIRDPSQRKGGTFFAPSNAAFELLGPTINEFLSGNDGLKYLRALLSYHIIFNHTLYSDAYWNVSMMTLDDSTGIYVGVSHIDLPTLLKDKSLSIDILDTHESIIFSKINGGPYHKMKDWIAWDGVIHTVEEIFIPPPKTITGGEEYRRFDGEMTLEEFIERFEPVEELIERLEPVVAVEEL